MLSYRDDLFKHAISQLFSQGFPRNDIHLLSELFFKKKTEAHEVKEVRVIRKVNENIYIACLLLLPSNNGAEETDITHFIFY